MLNVAATQELFYTIQSQQERINQQNLKISELEEKLKNITSVYLMKRLL